MVAVTPRRIFAQLDWAQDTSGVPVVDTGWFTAQAYDQILMARAAVLKQWLFQYPDSIPKDAQQTLDCVLLEEVPIEECPCVPPSGCTWWRSEILPDTISWPGLPGGFITVSGIGGNLEKLATYTYKDWTSVKYSLQSRIPAERERSYYCTKGKRVYFLQKKSVERVTLSAIFYDPVEVQRFGTCNEQTCKPFLDYDLYIPGDMEQAIFSMSVSSIMTLRQNSPFDRTNNYHPPLGYEKLPEE